MARTGGAELAVGLLSSFLPEPLPAIIPDTKLKVVIFAWGRENEREGWTPLFCRSREDGLRVSFLPLGW